MDPIGNDVIMRGSAVPTAGRLSGRQSQRGVSAIGVYQRQQSEVNESFLRAARDGNLDLVLEHLVYGQADVTTCNQNGLTALHLASKAGHANVVNELLERDCPVDCLTRKGNSSLHIAALAGHKDVVEILVRRGARVNLQSKIGFTALYMAAQENHAEVVKYLLDHGADQHIATQDGFTPMSIASQLGHKTVITILLDSDERRQKVRLPGLHAAAKRNDVRAAKILLQKEQDVGQIPDKVSAVNQTMKNGFTPLHLAAHYDSTDVGRLLIEHQANVDHKAKGNICPLHVASKWGRVAMARLLIDSNADIDIATKDGLTALHCASRNGRDEVVNLLIERGALLGAKTRSGLTPLHMSAQGDHVECARLLLSSGADINDVSTDYLTPLHVAAHCGNVKTAELLIKFRCDVDSRALNGFTPLHVACKKNRIKVVELLLRYGANIECTTESGLTPLHVGAYCGFVNIVACLLDSGAKRDPVTVRNETPLYLATRSHHYDVIDLLLTRQANVNIANNEGQAALHAAARMGDVIAVRMLLKYDADCNLQTRDLYTPLHLAVKEGHDEVTKILLDSGAKQNLKTKKGFTALHVAAKYNQVSTLRVLVKQKGANVNITGMNGLSPLHVATHYNNLEVILVLLENDANTKLSAKNGYTALHIAAKRNHVDIAKVLLRYGANVNAESKTGYTPLHLAAQEGHCEMVSLLVGPGGKANANCQASRNHLTPMHLAAQENHVPVAEILVEHQGQLEPQTKAGYTPLHTACHFGQLEMVEYLVRHGSSVDGTTQMGHTPLHLASQQGHLMIVKSLLNNNASPDLLTADGQTALSIAKHLGFISIIEVLQQVTAMMVATPTVDFHYNIVFPETMQELLMDSDEEGGDEFFTSSRGSTLEYHGNDDQEAAENAEFEDSIFRKRPGRTQEDLFSFEESGRQSTMSTLSWSGYSRDLIAEEMHYMRESGGGAMTPSSNLDLTEFKPWSDDTESTTPGVDGLLTPGLDLDSEVKHLMRMDSRPLCDDMATPETANILSEGQVHPLESAPGDGVARLYSRLARRALSEDVFEDDRIDPARMSTLSTGADYRHLFGTSFYNETSIAEEGVAAAAIFSGFLVSFIVDARGAVMTGRRQSGVRVIVAPGRTCEPTRVVCKLIAKEKLSNPPGLSEGEALASRILDMGPHPVKFHGPVLLEVPHFAVIDTKEREVVILRSDNGISWTEHTIPTTDDNIQKSLGTSFADQLEPAETVFATNNVARIVCTDLPHYFALVTRPKQASKTIGPSGGLLSSTVVPQVQVVFPETAITKPIKVGLQAIPVKQELLAKILPDAIPDLTASPVVTVEPRPRRFHQPITVTIPLPPGSSLLKETNQKQTHSESLRLLCSISGCYERTRWSDITGSTPLKLTNNCVSFVTDVSARFWLIDCHRNTSSDDVTNFANNLFEQLVQVPFSSKVVLFGQRAGEAESQLRLFCITDDKVLKPLEQQQNYLQLAQRDNVQISNGQTIRVSVNGLNPVVESDDQLIFKFTALRENRLHIRTTWQQLTQGKVQMVLKKVDADEDLTRLEFNVPGTVSEQPVATATDGVECKDWKQFVNEAQVDRTTVISKTHLKLTDIAESIQADWVNVAFELGFNESGVSAIHTEYTYPAEQALVMLNTWIKRQGDQATANELQRALRAVGRDDVIESCMTSPINVVTDASERLQALEFFQQESERQLKAEQEPDDVNDEKEQDKKLDAAIAIVNNSEPAYETEIVAISRSTEPQASVRNSDVTLGPTAEDSELGQPSSDVTGDSDAPVSLDGQSSNADDLTNSRTAEMNRQGLYRWHRVEMDELTEEPEESEVQANNGEAENDSQPVCPVEITEEVQIQLSHAKLFSEPTVNTDENQTDCSSQEVNEINEESQEIDKKERQRYNEEEPSEAEKPVEEETEWPQQQQQQQQSPPPRQASFDKLREEPYRSEDSLYQPLVKNVNGISDSFDDAERTEDYEPLTNAWQSKEENTVYQQLITNGGKTDEVVDERGEEADETVDDAGEDAKIAGKTGEDAGERGEEADETVDNAGETGEGAEVVDQPEKQADELDEPIEHRNGAGSDNDDRDDLQEEDKIHGTVELNDDPGVTSSSQFDEDVESGQQEHQGIDGGYSLTQDEEKSQAGLEEQVTSLEPSDLVHKSNYGSDVIDADADTAVSQEFDDVISRSSKSLSVEDSLQEGDYTLNQADEQDEQRPEIDMASYGEQVNSYRYSQPDDQSKTVLHELQEADSPLTDGGSNLEPFGGGKRYDDVASRDEQGEYEKDDGRVEMEDRETDEQYKRDNGAIATERYTDD